MNYTIDKMHKEHLNNINKNNKKIKSYLNEKKELTKKLSTSKDIKEKSDILSSIDKIDKNIKKINSKYDELDYFDKSIDILINYYDIEKNNSEPNKEMDMSKMFNNVICDNTKTTLHNRYMKNVKNINVDFNNDKKKVCKNPKCNGKELTLHITNGYFICRNCGSCEELIIEGDKTSYKEYSNENSIYAYKRINHFNEWLSQFQGKESTDIPDELYNKIVIELKKERISDLKNINIEKMRKILKNLGYNKYYEHIPHILSKIGKRAPKISKLDEEKLRLMFKQIQEPFNIYCPKNRKNFLSYSYTLHKFCELLELDDLAELFPMLKSRDKLKEQDILWSQICKHLRWEYIPSI